MRTLEELASNEQIKEEYKRTFLLNLFQKLCVRMNNDNGYHEKIRTLFRQSFDKVQTTKKIIEKEFNFEVSVEDASLVAKWLLANLKKTSTRRPISKETKRNLCEVQNWRCMVCGEELGKDYSKIHVDHIVPWKLVGDELEDNYQALCETCNECKSAKIDYIFKNMINLI